MSDEHYQALAFSFETKQMSLIDDDSGFKYAISTNAGADKLISPLLYSIDKRTGAVFLVHNHDAEHPHFELVTQDLLTNYDVLPGSIQRSVDKEGKRKKVFSSLLIGEIIRFRSNGVDHGAMRTILSATTNKITFDPVEGLANTSEFVIAASRFRIRFAPFKGADQRRVKSLQGTALSVRHGSREPVPGAFVRARIYENYNSVSRSEDTVEIFDGEESGRMTDDRVLSLEGQSTTLEIEIEMLDAKVDFRLEHLALEIEEEADTNADQQES